MRTTRPIWLRAIQRKQIDLRKANQAKPQPAAGGTNSSPDLLTTAHRCVAACAGNRAPHRRAHRQHLGLQAIDGGDRAAPEREHKPQKKRMSFPSIDGKGAEYAQWSSSGLTDALRPMPTGNPRIRMILCAAAFPGERILHSLTWTGMIGERDEACKSCASFRNGIVGRRSCVRRHMRGCDRRGRSPGGVAPPARFSIFQTGVQTEPCF